jgi:cation transport regulator
MPDWSHVIEVPRPHGFLLWRGKQTAVPAREPLPAGEPCLLVSGGEAFGTVTLGQAASMQVGEFDRIEWADRHRTRPEERKMWWKGARKLVVQDVTKAEWYPESVPVDATRDDDGLIVDVLFKDTAPVTDDEQALISRAQRMPRLIMLSSDALALSGAKLHAGAGVDVVAVDEKAKPLLPFYKGQLETALCAVFGCPEDGITYTDTKDCCRLPLYWLALVRAPRFGIERSDVDQPDFKSLDVDQLRHAWVKQSAEVDMPYSYEDYPEQIENLPEAARRLWVDAYNAAFEEHNDEDIARRVAWTVVNRDYERGDDGEWMAREKQAVTKTERGMEFTADAYLYVPTPHKPGLWKLRIEESPGEITRKQLGLAAAALGPGLRGQRVELPDDERRNAARKLVAEYRKLDTPDGDIPVYLWRLADLKPPEEAKGAALHWAFSEEHPDAWVAEIQASNLVVLDGDKTYQVPYDGGGFVGREGWVEVSYQPVEETEKPEPQPEAEKEGRRLRGDRIGLLRDLKDRLGGLGNVIADLLSWAEYDDGEPETIAELFNKEAGFAIKEVDGEPWFFSWSANAFKDRDEEIFSTAALEHYVDEAETKQERGWFNFWHIPGTDFARKEWQAVVGRFLVEAGPFLDDEKGQAASKFFDKYPDGHPDYAPEGWGASVEYKYLPEERDTGVYKWIWITRTTALPRSTAANIWTESGKGAHIMLLEGQRKEAAVALFGEEFVDKLETDAEKRTEELEADVEFKEAEPPVVVTEEETEAEPEVEAEAEPVTEEVTTEAIEATPEFVEAVADKVGEKFTIDLQPVVDVIGVLTKGVDGLGERVAKLEKDESLKQKTELPRFQLQMVKRASESEETVVEKDDALRESKPTETEKQHVSGSAADAFFGAK